MIDRSTLGEWEEDGRLDAGMRARARVEDLLASHTPEPLAEDLQAQLSEIMMKDARALGMEELPVFGDDLLVPVGA